MREAFSVVLTLVIVTIPVTIPVTIRGIIDWRCERRDAHRLARVAIEYADLLADIGRDVDAMLSERTDIVHD